MAAPLPNTMRPPRLTQYVLFSMAALALGIQFIPVALTNPPVSKELVWDSPQTQALARRACYDCHSNEVQWPWYARIAPASWLIAHDVKSARERLNFSAISEDDRVGLLVKQITSGSMPPTDYRALHAPARLTPHEKNEYIAGLRRSFELSGLGPNSSLK